MSIATDYERHLNEATSAKDVTVGTAGRFEREVKARKPALGWPSLSRADDGTRTRDPHLGKVMRYQLRYVRVCATGGEPKPMMRGKQ